MRLACLAFALPIVLGCSASSPTGFGGGGTGATGSGSGSGGATSTSSSSAGSGGSGSGTGGGFTFGTGGFGQGGDGGGAPPATAEVFAHSPDTLYKLDPDTKITTVVGPFQGCDQVIDIALDKDGVMFGTTFGGLFRIDKTNAACTHIADGGYPNSLSFVPKGTVDQNAEALVGYLGSTYVRIDTTTGVMTTIGAINGGYASSGDIVSVIGGGTYLTVNGNGCGDCIIEVDPKTGDMKQMIGPLGHSSVFGLAFWGGVAYGFDAFGELFQIDLGSATTTVIPTTPGLVFWGAGSTTAAPLEPPH
jgi:hypothetical protein